MSVTSLRAFEYTFIAVTEILAVPVFYCNVQLKMSVPVAARSKAWVCGRSTVEIVGSNPAGGMDVCLL
jgi:hypothetical protein